MLGLPGLLGIAQRVIDQRFCGMCVRDGLGRVEDPPHIFSNRINYFGRFSVNFRPSSPIKTLPPTNQNSGFQTANFPEFLLTSPKSQV